MDSAFRVLVADHGDHQVCRMLEGMQAVAVVGEVTDGGDVAALAERHQPDLIVLDARDRGLDGATSLPQIHRAAPHAAVVLLANHFEDDEREAEAIATMLLQSLRRGPFPNVHGEVSLRLDADPISASLARRFVTSTLQMWRCEELTESAVLLTSELVTNAVIHAASPATLVLRLATDVLRVEVRDRSATAPAPREVPISATGGRGLALVDSLACAWGVAPLPSGKSVWFDLPIPQGTPTHN